MAYQQSLQTRTKIVNADMTTKQYFIMKASSTKMALCTAGVQPIGVLQDTPAADGRPGCLGFDGVSKVVAGGAITAGDYVASDSAGKAVTAVSGDFPLGIAETAATTDGDVISVSLMPGLGKEW